MPKGRGYNTPQSPSHNLPGAGKKSRGMITDGASLKTGYKRVSVKGTTPNANAAMQTRKKIPR